MKKPATKAEKEHMAFIASLSCVICGDRPVEVHHLVECGRRLGNMYCLPLCVFHHRGDAGFSGKNRAIKTFAEQWDLMTALYSQHSIEIPHRVSKIVPRRLT